MYTGSSSGYYGSGDFYARREDDSAIRKLQEGYWTAKQAVKAKLGKKEDDHLVASDQELDAKLALFASIRDSCEAMLRCIENYQDFLCELSGEENALGRFLKQRGKADKTQAGRMMAAVGRAQSFTAQQRLALRVPLVRLYQELDVFTERAVEDCGGTVEAVERARTEYRGSLLWMKKVSESLDPDAYNRLDKFRTVQAAVKRNKAKFDQAKLNCLQKVDLLAASRCNLFSSLMSNYQRCLLHFWERTAKAHATVSDNFKGYQHYEFTILKDLSETSRKLAELTAGEGEEEQRKEKDEAAEQRAHDIAAELISLEAKGEAAAEAKKAPVGRQSSMEDMLFGETKESPEAAKEGLDFLDTGDRDTNTAAAASASAGSQLDALFADMMGELDSARQTSAPATSANEESSFSSIWASFEGGRDVAATPAPPNNETPELINFPCGDGKEKGKSEGSPVRGPKGVLPSQLLDLAPATASSSSKEGKADAAGSKKEPAWFSLFAELDPLKQSSNQGSL